MGSLKQLSTDLRDRIPGRRRGPAVRVRSKGRRGIDRAEGASKRLVRAAGSGAGGAVASVRSVAEGAREGLTRGPRRERWRRRVGAAAAAGTAGAAGYFLDPNSGKRRRHIARDRIAALVRRGGRKAESTASDGAETVAGKAKGAASSVAPSETPSDEALADRVRSEVFRPADAPKGSVNVNVVDGVVYLRGELGDSDRIRELVSAVESIDGVKRVESLLHTPA